MRYKDSMRRVLRAGVVTAVLLIIPFGFTSETANGLEGTWSSTEGAKTISFYGNQVGCKVEGETEKCFKYTLGADNALALNFGSESQSVTATIDGSTLTITDAKGNATAYKKVSTAINECQKKILQLDAARDICKQADTKLTVVPLRETLEYLKEIPECPNGGTYMIQPNQNTSCSLNCTKEGGAK